MSQTSPRWSAAPPANKDTSTSNSFSNVRPISPWAASVSLVRKLYHVATHSYPLFQHYPFDRLPPILYCLGLPLKTTDLGIAKLPLPFVGYARSLVDRFPMIVPVTWEEVEANHRKPETRYLCMLYVDSIPGGVEETCMVMREPKLVYHFTEGSSVSASCLSQYSLTEAFPQRRCCCKLGTSSVPTRLARSSIHLPLRL
jgi:hypothetical protein